MKPGKNNSFCQKSGQRMGWGRGSTGCTDNPAARSGLFKEPLTTRSWPDDQDDGPWTFGLWNFTGLCAHDLHIFLGVHHTAGQLQMKRAANLQTRGTRAPSALPGPNGLQELSRNGFGAGEEQGVLSSLSSHPLVSRSGWRMCMYFPLAVYME